jgi:hypothetical protein
LFAACQSQQEVKVVEVTATPSPTANVTILYVTATPTSNPARAPRLVSRLPSQPTIDERQPTITLNFNQPMDAASVTAALSMQPAVPFTVETHDRTAIIQLSEPLAFETEYRFTLADTAVDLSGNHLYDEYVWQHHLAEPLAGVSGPSNNHPDTPITIRFNYPMDEASVSQTLRIEPAVSGKLTWNENRKVASLTPNTRLEAETTYTISFSGPLVDADGRDLPIPIPAQFTTPPPILSQGPTGHSASPNSSIQVRFDRPMDAASTEAAFHLEPAVNGSFIWDETTLRFYAADGYLTADTTYTVTINPTALSAEGEAILSEAFSWSFSTHPTREIANFGYGPNAQVLDINGRRAIQFQTTTQPGSKIGFELYRLNLAQFLDRYSSNFKSWEMWGDNSQQADISTADAELAHSWQMQTIDSPAEHVNVQETIIPAEVPPGLYILNLTAGGLNDQLILALTANTLAVKQAEGQIVVWLTDINGNPLPRVTVGVYARNGDLLAEGVTDEIGVFRTELPAFEAGGPAAVEPLIVVAQTAENITVSGLSHEWQSGSGYYNWWQSTPQNPQSAAFITTDRPIYKPGQDVHFKVIVRQDEDAVLSLPPTETEVVVRIRDGRNNIVQTFALATNDFGTVNGTFQLAEGAMLGHYNVEAELDGTSHRQLFKVEDYRKPDYEVTLTTNATKYLPGDSIEITIDSAYFFGEPVANASVTVRQLRQEQYWSENGPQTSWYEGYGTSNRTMTGRTDANGRLTLTLPIPTDTYLGESYSYDWSWGSNLRTVTWGLEATVNDGSQQTVSGFATVQLYGAAERIEANTGGYVQEPGRPFPITADVQTIFDEPVANRALKVELARWNNTIYDYSNVVQSANLTTNSDGRATTQFTIEEPGFYQLRLVGTDAHGRAIRYTDYVYAFGDSAGAWYGRSDGGLYVNSVENEYAPGETAQIVVESTISGPALLTVERGTTRREQLVHLTAPLTILDLPIVETDTPNIYVAINVWQPLTTTIQQYTESSLPDGHLLTAGTNLSIPATDKRLTVTITPDQAQYAPREEATFSVRVTNYRGEPVSAELSLALVDEAIFALSEELSGPMYDAFYYERDAIVRTYHSLRPSRQFWEGGMGGGGDDVGYAGGPRADFPDTAAWFPVLHTDHNGEAAVTITLPDSLTSWRMTAKATTADTQVGEATINITTWQPIIVRPLLPRMLTTGDTAVLSAMIHNYSAAPQTLTVELTLPDSQFTIHNSQFQTLTLPPNQSRIIGWPVKATEAGQAEVLVTAVPQSNLQGDSIQLPLTVQPLAIPDVQTQVGQFSSQLRTTVQIPANALPMSVVELQLSRSIAGTLLEGLEYLTGYPYGCVEQTMSKALPNAVVGRALNQLGLTNPTLQAELPGYINASIQRLYGYQHNDGGWGWWFDDPSHDYQTAWVIFGLAQVAEAGYEVDPAVIERGMGWLSNNLNEMDARTRAFALYAMAEAGQPNRDATLALANDRESLQGDVFSLAGLALTLDALGEDVLAQEIVDRLAERARTANGRTHWAGTAYDGYYHQKTMASDVRSTALALSAFTQIRPGHELEGGIVRWLMGQRRSQGWGSTNETSFAILGLTDHLLAAAFSETAANTNYTVSLNGAVIAEGALGKGAPAVTLQIPQEQLGAGENEIVVMQDGGRPLYYTLNSRTYVAQAEIGTAGVIEIERTYLDPETNKPLESLTAGQLVKVRLIVRMPERGSYMIVEDKLPGGLEALNEGLNTTSKAADNYWMYNENAYSWQELGYNYKEIFGDRVSFFITEMTPSAHTFTYLARATLPGEFTAMPAQAYGMYNPTLWGRSASHQLAVEVGE